MKNRRWWSVLKVLLTVACLFWVLNLLQGGFPEPEKIWNALCQIPWYWHVAAGLSATVNWWIETLKWQLLVSNIEKLRFANAIKGLLAGAAANHVLPFRVGEFLGRVMYLKEENRPAALLNNYFGAACQTLITLVAGIPAAYALLGSKAERYGQNSIVYVLTLFLLLGIGWFMLKTRAGKPAWIEKWLKGFRNFSAKQIAGAFGLSLLRYGVFGGFYIFFIVQFQLAEFNTAVTGVACIFFIQTFTPGMIYTDAAVRLSLPLLVFPLPDEQKHLLMGIALINYFYNVLLPAILGVIIFTLHKWKR